MKIAICNCLNMAGSSEARRAVDSAVLAYYAALKPKGYTLLLHAVGSSQDDEAAALASGWTYTEAPNENVGRKRNAGVQAAIDAGADILIRIGSDDVASLALIDEIARRGKIGHEGYWELKGFYVYDVPNDRLVLSPVHQFGFAYRVDRLKGDLYREDVRVFDAGIDIKGRSWGEPWYQLSSPKKYPFIAMKSGDEINSFEQFHSAFWRYLEEAESSVLTDFFPQLELDSTSSE